MYGKLSNQCNMKLKNTHLMCFNELCPTYCKMKNGLDEFESILNIRLSLTDCTGTLDNCVLHHQTATKILNGVSCNENIILFLFNEIVLNANCLNSKLTISITVYK